MKTDQNEAVMKQERRNESGETWLVEAQLEREASQRVDEVG